MDMLQSVFQDKLLEDDRESLVTFEIPGVQGQFGLYPPKLLFWQQLVVILLLQIAIQVVFAALIYKLIVERRKHLSASLVGYGAIIPIALYIPFWLLDYLDIRNKTLKLAFMTVPTVVVFRTLEAISETSPHTVESSLGTYMTYYTALSHFEWDPVTNKRRKITFSELWSKFVSKIFWHFHILSLVLSLEMHFDFKPFASPVEINEYHFNTDLLRPCHLGNAYLLAILTNLVLALGFELTAFADNVKGYYTKPIFLNPIFTSRSPTEFWGRKWNLLIHRTLKHAVFLPARQVFGVTTAMALTFAASGLLHEMSWMVLFYNHGRSTATTDECEGCFQFIFFKVTAFFLWNAVVMVLEKKVGHVFAFMKSWPTLIVSTLVVLTALPVSHWFTGDWAAGGYYSDFAIGLWHIRKMQ